MTDARQIDDADERTTGDERSRADARDRAVVEAQIGRSPRAMAGVGARCVYGLPAATHQAPLDADGKPFPTAYYLTCPHLVKQIDRLESAGGVVRYEGLLERDPELRAATDAAHDRHHQLDARGANIAAASDRTRLKCLHAHAAFALAQGDHPLGELVLREAAPRWCDDARCATHLPE